MARGQGNMDRCYATVGFLNFSLSHPVLIVTVLQVADMVYRGVDSFNTWRAFAANYGDMKEEGLGYHVSRIPEPYHSLRNYLSGAMPVSNGWITYVTIFNLQIGGPDMAFLGDFPNLGTLHFIKSTSSNVIYETDGAFDPDDAIIRSWSRAAKSEGAFSKLRVLKLINQSKITGFCLPWLRGFPALFIFECNRQNVTQDQISSSSSLGWNLVHSREELEERCKRSKPEQILKLRKQRYYIYAGMLKREIKPGLDDEIIADDKKPVHEFRIGHGNDSTHLSTTQTIIFERVAWYDDPEEQNLNSDTALIKRKVETSFGVPGHAKKPKVPKRALVIKPSRQTDVGDLLDLVGGSGNT